METRTRKTMVWKDDEHRLRNGNVVVINGWEIIPIKQNRQFAIKFCGHYDVYDDAKSAIAFAKVN